VELVQAAFALAVAVNMAATATTASRLIRDMHRSYGRDPRATSGVLAARRCENSHPD